MLLPLSTPTAREIIAIRITWNTFVFMNGTIAAPRSEPKLITVTNRIPNPQARKSFIYYCHNINRILLASNPSYICLPDP